MTVQSAKNAFRNPRTKGTRTFVYGQILWGVLVKTGWLPFVAHALYLPDDFFSDAEVTGHIGLALAWFIREAQEAYRWIIALSIQMVKGWMRK